MSVWPTPAQDLLLRAALLPDERAGAAWRRARQDIEVATLDAEAAMVLPLVRHNLVARGVEDDLFGLFKGVQRHTWARTQLLLAPLMPVVAALEAAGIPTLLLKGGALVADARLTAGLRPMNDLDVLVPTGRRADAVAVLADHGLVPFDGLADWHVVELVPEHSPSYPFVDARDRELDLHWHVLHDSCQPEADDDFWAAAVPIELLGVRTRALCPADELLLVLLHGMRWSPSPPLRWALDAGLLASGALGPIGYDRLVGQARRRRLGAAVEAALAYLVRTADVPVPDGVLRSLRRRSPAERLAVRARSTRPGDRGRLLRAVYHHEQHLARTLPLGRRATAVARLRAERDRRRGRLVVDGAATVGPRAPTPIAIGVPLDLRRPETVRAVVESGTWRSEPGGCWLAGPKAELRLDLAEPASGALVLDLAAAPYRGGPQRLRVAVDGQPVAATTARGPLALSAPIPGRLLAGAQTIGVDLCTPDAVVPALVGDSDDDRPLSLHVQTITLREPPLVALGQMVEFGAGTADDPFLAGGWSWAEDSGRWSDGPAAAVVLRLAGGAPTAMGLRLTPSGRQRVDVRVNGRRVARLTLPASALSSWHELPLLTSDAGPAGDLVIELAIRRPRSPRSLGTGEDPRALGVCLHELVVA